MVTITMERSVIQLYGSSAFEIRATLHCRKINNYKVTTMFLLQIKYFMHELGVDVV